MMDDSAEQGPGSLAGQQLGDYKLIRLLGIGHTSEVYLGQDINKQTLAAIKVFTHLSREDLQKIRREVTTLKGLTHPNIVRVLGFEVENNPPFIAIDYMRGGTLRSHCPEGSKLSLEAVVSYIEQIATAAQYAHEHGILHRDIKPENILLSEDKARALLSDFGIASFERQSLELLWAGWLKRNLLKLWLTFRQKRLNGMSLASLSRHTGTLRYMAPERLRYDKDRACQASDQYALGVVTYELLCGKLPFYGSARELMVQHIEKAPPPFRDEIAIPPEVEQVVQRALAKDPNQRYPSMQAFASALKDAYSRALELDRQNNDYWHSLWDAVISRRGAVFALATALIVVTMAELEANMILHEPTPTDRKVHKPEPIYTYRGHQAIVRTIASSSTGLIASGDDNGEIHVWDIYGKTWTVYREHSARVTGISFFADGERIASVSLDGTLRMWYARTGQHVYTKQGNNVLEPYPDPPVPYSMFTVAWSVAQGSSPTSEHVALNIGRRVLILDDPTQYGYDKKREQDPTYIGHTDNVYSVAWPPDPAKKIVASASADTTVQVWDVYTGKGLVYKGHTKDVLTVAWSLDSKLIASGGDDMTVQVWDAATGTLLFMKQNLPGAVNAVAWLPNKHGRYVAWATANGSVEVWDVDRNRQIHNYPGHTGSVNALALSPGDSMIASGGDDKTVQVWQVP